MYYARSESSRIYGRTMSSSSDFTFHSYSIGSSSILTSMVLLSLVLLLCSSSLLLIFVGRWQPASFLNFCEAFLASFLAIKCSFIFFLWAVNLLAIFFSFTPFLTDLVFFDFAFFAFLAFLSSSSGLPIFLMSILTMLSNLFLSFLLSSIWPLIYFSKK